MFAWNVIGESGENCFNRVVTPEGKTHVAWVDAGLINVISVDPEDEQRPFGYETFASREAYCAKWWDVEWFTAQNPKTPPILSASDRVFWGTRFSLVDVLDTMDSEHRAVRLWESLSEDQQLSVFEALERRLEKGFEAGMMMDWTAVAQAALSESELLDEVLGVVFDKWDMEPFDLITMKPTSESDAHAIWERRSEGVELFVDEEGGVWTPRLEHIANVLRAS